MEGLSSITHIGQEIYGDDVEVSFPSLQELSVRDFPLLQQWARLDGKETFPRLRKLILNNCPHLISVPHFTSLEHLELRHCTSTVLKCMEHLTLLSTLAIEGFNELLCLPGELIRNNQLLKSVRITLAKASFSNFRIRRPHFPHSPEHPLVLTALPGNVMEGLKSLQDLSIENCSSLASISFGLQQLSALKTFDHHEPGNTQLSRTQRFARVVRQFNVAKSIAISDCRNLKFSASAVRRLTKLQHLTIQDCPDLQRRCQQDRGEDWWKIAHIPRRHIFSSESLN
ncbi:UNVERIFIED_CONTAM: hypothetical protein Sradi_2831300 [Sesamum radiatum]|uniref:Uncharacterized protein n=1 Tax=Sesamum radiatum TaxID=300843 RepID=A0AAW2RW02_SESRA